MSRWKSRSNSKVRAILSRPALGNAGGLVFVACSLSLSEAQAFHVTKIAAFVTARYTVRPDGSMMTLVSRNYFNGIFGNPRRCQGKNLRLSQQST